MLDYRLAARYFRVVSIFTVVAMLLMPIASISGTAVAQEGSPPNVPYDLPVTLPPTLVSSPEVNVSAPYTPVVLSLLAQLTPSNPPTQAELANAAKLVGGRGTNPSCHGTGGTAAPTGTTPSITAICWADAQGILNTSGPNARGSTAPMTLMGLAATFDLNLANIWGQTEGTEAREFMITGIYGPQGDIDRIPNWGRNLTTTGEDPYLAYTMVAAQVDGMQGAGAMSQMKHFGVYNGQNQNNNTDVQDQALHEMFMAPYEGGYVGGKASAAMCSYAIFRDISNYLPGPTSSLWPTSPFATGTEPLTWPLNQSHFSCEQPLLNYILRHQWGSQAYVATDYGAVKSAAGMVQGTDEEMPSSNYYNVSNPGTTGNAGLDATGNTCADTAGNPVDCSTPGAVHVAGIPGPGCPARGCGLVNAILNGTMPLSVYQQSLARILYQEERFGMLGCNDNPASPSCTNPGGVNGDRSGNAPLPIGETSGIPVPGTKNGGAAIVEKYSEMGATLLKNDDKALPITSADLDGGILITGSSANHTVADPTNEASLGFVDRNAVNPLQQLIAFTGRPEAFTFVPANDPTGMPVPGNVMSIAADSVTGALARTTGPGAPLNDSIIDFTTVSGYGQLEPGSYTWEGYIYVPSTDTYTFRLLQSSNVPNANVTFTFDGTLRTLANASNIYGASVPGTPTNAGYTEALLTNRQFVAGSLTSGTYHPLKITFDNTSGGSASFRFAYSRTNGDIADAATAAVGKSKAIVFVNTGSGTTNTIPNPYGSSPATISAPISLSSVQTNLISAVAAANPNTIVVINNDNPVLTPWIGDVKALLDMWFAGQEGGTSTARILLGLANPSGHTALTWPMNATDTIWAYNQPMPLYPGDTAGPHLERLNNGPNGTTIESEGIYFGYRYFDKMGIEPRFPFGFGLSYTSFAFSDLKVKSAEDGGLNVSFTIQNTGEMAGADVAQVYVGPPAVQPEGVQFAVKALAQYSRVELQPSEARQVSLHVDPRQLSYWSEQKQQWVLDPDGRAIFVGDASSYDHLPLQTVWSKEPIANTVCANTQISTQTIDSNLVIPDGAWCNLIKVTVNGNLIVHATSGVRVADSFINGNLIASYPANASNPYGWGANTISGSNISGNFTIEYSAAASPWLIGTQGGNMIGGVFQFNYNAASENTISNNVVSGIMNCEGNGAVLGSGNTARKLKGQCSGLK